MNQDNLKIGKEYIIKINKEENVLVKFFSYGFLAPHKEFIFRLPTPRINPITNKEYIFISILEHNLIYDISETIA